MKNSIIALTLIVTACAPHARRDFSQPSLQKINIIDNNGFSETISNPDRLKQYQNTNFISSQPYQKVLRIYKRDREGNIKSVITSYHSNGQPKQYLDVVNNRAFGAYKEWHSNGHKKIEACVIGGDADIESSAQLTWFFDGRSFVWDEYGNLEAEILYSKGELEGDSLYYHPNGNIWKRIPFHQNKIDGLVEIFCDDCQLLQTTQFIQGERQGKSLRYWDDLHISTDEDYENDNLVNAIYYDLNRKEVARIRNGIGYRALFSRDGLAELQEYRNGNQEGQIQIFSNDKDPIIVYHTKNNLKHGEEIEYYPRKNLLEKPHPKISISWFEGCIQGTVKTWYDNGVQESQREISNNEKNGLYTAWYRDGSLMMIEEYDINKLVKGKYFKKGESNYLTEVHKGEGVATIFDPEGNFIQKIKYSQGWPDYE